LFLLSSRRRFRQNPLARRAAIAYPDTLDSNCCFACLAPCGGHFSMRTTFSRLRYLALPILAVIGSTLTVNPILAAEPAEELKAIRELLKKIDERLENQNTISLQMLEKQKFEFSQLKTDFNQLRDEIAQARRDLADLRGRSTGALSSSSYYGGSTPYVSGSAPAAPLGATASIRLVNTYLTDMNAVINGAYYTVPPGQTTTVPVAPGFVNYQVLQTQPIAKSTTLNNGEVLTLRLFPR
jgi:hypothetical protein